MGKVFKDGHWIHTLGRCNINLVEPGEGEDVLEQHGPNYFLEEGVTPCAMSQYWMMA